MVGLLLLSPLTLVFDGGEPFYSIQFADAAIVLDATSTSGGTGGFYTSVTYNHTVGSNTNGVIIVACGGNGGSAWDITTATYAGANMSPLGSRIVSGIGAIHVWYKLVPSTGSNNVVMSTGASNLGECNSASFTGVQQTANASSTVAFLDANGTGSPQSHSTADGLFAGDITTSADNSFPFLALSKNGGATPSAGSNTKLLWWDTSDYSSATLWGHTSGTITPASTVTLNVNTGASNKSVGVYFSIAPYVASTPAALNQIIFFQ